MLDYFKLKYSEKLPVSFLENIQSQEFKLKLHRNNKFDGFFHKNELKLDYYPLMGNAFDIISIVGKMDRQSFLVEYRLSKMMLYIYIFSYFSILIGYFLDLFKIVDAGGLSDTFIPLIFPFVIYFILVGTFYFSLLSCKEALQELIKT